MYSGFDFGSGGAITSRNNSSIPAGENMTRTLAGRSPAIAKEVWYVLGSKYKRPLGRFDDALPYLEVHFTLQYVVILTVVDVWRWPCAFQS